ncbi:MAG: Sec-independent protein translocase subunit TatA [Actinomycetota bacterium]
MGDAFAPWHIIILVVVFMVLFGARKLPGAAQALGQSMRIFKAETKGLVHDDDKDAPTVTAAPAANPVTAAQQFSAPQPTQQDQIEALQRQLNDLKSKPADGVPVAGAPLSEAQPNQPG